MGSQDYENGNKKQKKNSHYRFKSFEIESGAIIIIFMSGLYSYQVISMVTAWRLSHKSTYGGDPPTNPWFCPPFPLRPR